MTARISVVNGEIMVRLWQGGLVGEGNALDADDGEVHDMVAHESCRPWSSRGCCCEIRVV